MPIITAPLSEPSMPPCPSMEPTEKLLMEMVGILQAAQHSPPAHHSSTWSGPSMFTIMTLVTLACCALPVVAFFCFQMGHFGKLVDAIVAEVLRGQGMRSAIANLVSDLLQRPDLAGTISHLVGRVLRDEGLRADIGKTVVAALDEPQLRQQIAQVVRGVLVDAEVEGTIHEVVSRAVASEPLSVGIVGAIKGTAGNVLSEASELALRQADERLPTWMTSAAKSRLFASRQRLALAQQNGAGGDGDVDGREVD